ncbi:extracellular solute-binding protein family 1 [Xylanimonas cellulosilytica DSM 15894]|uniref:Extracellular solute-binding protein family 1 n=1 Tax=Xylanimonas cellulosilytica (strain DSM 15894 / JCM 12276 / CECT 5975 / KCTC 9989 / LMG 20990 / NBRC 107835 / XIL07) TaxID=446471 RepID=D1BVH9_XYLCX|nr:extracellular solute-binding protein [Xylanimonas cellulosilytica]ACZ29450.1 extracellular solute-binding protein family 1 [Xylanimonas cellulosilytica DSM 15894]
MKLTRTLAATAAVAALALTSACSQPSAGTPDDEYSSTVDQKAGADATTLSLWTFVELHGAFYETMAAHWNEQNPDKQVKLDVNVMPYDDMHNKLQLALNSGDGVPDLVDIELGKFPNFTKGTPPLEDLTAYAEPYAADLVQARLDLYSKAGKTYGFDFHVGTTLAFYNTELLDAAGVDYTSITTWDDYQAAGVKYHEATGKSFATADTSALWQANLLLGQLGGDYLDADGTVTVDSPEVVEAFDILKGMQDSGAASVPPGGQPDTEEAYGAINSGDFAAMIMPEWFMSRFTAYMPELKGKIAIAPAPVVAGAKVKTVGGGGTGTAVPSAGEHADLAAEFIAYAKLSKDGNVEIWQTLGFDPMNTSMWEDESITHDPSNEYVQYFQTNPFDVLNEVSDSIGLLVSSTSENAPSVGNLFTTETLNNIFESGTPVADALAQAQSDLKNELGQ